MKHVLLLSIFGIAAGVLAPAVQAASPDPQKTRELLAIVQSQSDLAARARALQQLTLVATKDAIPVVTPMLGDEKLGQYARDVLEVMPDPAAGDALRAALQSLQGKSLVGIVNSLGMRRDGKAVDALARLTREGAPELAGPALLALGRIGTPDALEVIEPLITSGPVERRAAAGEAALIVAERLSRAGDASAALPLYEKIRGAELPLPLRVSATRGAIATSGSRALPLLLEQLHSSELAMRDVALRAVRELRDPHVTPRLVAELDRLSPEMQALVIAALVDRGESSALSAIEARAKVGHEEVRIAALRSLGKLGQASSLPILLRAITSAPNTPIASAALVSLTRMPAPEANAFVQQALFNADTATRAKLIGVLGDRKAEGATPLLMKLASGPDLEVSKAAFRALGLLARPSDLPQLIRLAIGASDDAVKSLADRAIVTTAMKVLQPERRADAVLTAFRQETDPATKAALVRPLGAIVRSMGSSHEVFFALRAAVKDKTPRVREAALQALADWPDATPTMPLLEIANNPSAPVAEREAALAGAIRMATNVAGGRERSPLNVVEAFTQANRAVSTPAQKLMIVSGLGSLKRPEAVRMLQPYLNDPAVQAEAALAVVQIAPALAGPKPSGELRAMLEQIAATDKDEDVRRRATQIATGAAPAGGKEKAKGKGKKAAAAAAASASGGPELFNGRDLGGWDGDPAVWRVRDAVIIGGSLEGNLRNEFLATTRRFRNFVLRLEYRLTGTEGFVNGGVQFASVRVAQPPNEMSGYQADIGAGHSGCLYDESRRKKFLARATDDQIKQLEKPGDWNRYEIRCEGAKIELSLNGQRTVTYVETDPSVKSEGLIALQIHGNSKAEIAFRNLELTELP
jgi:HEAT repeat protein